MACSDSMMSQGMLLRLRKYRDKFEGTVLVEANMGYRHRPRLRTHTFVIQSLDAVFGNKTILNMFVNTLRSKELKPMSGSAFVDGIELI